MIEMCKIVIPLLPPSVNTYWRRGQYSTYLSKKGREFKENVKAILIAEKIKKTEKRLLVTINLFFKGKRKRDIDNYNKAILDSFNGIVWGDDEQIERLIISKEYNHKSDFFTVEVEEI